MIYDNNGQRLLSARCALLNWFQLEGVVDVAGVVGGGIVACCMHFNEGGGVDGIGVAGMVDCMCYNFGCGDVEGIGGAVEASDVAGVAGCKDILVARMEARGLPHGAWKRKRKFTYNT